jgi:N-acetylated-alpha-linked acidic dipeptidase
MRKSVVVLVSVSLTCFAGTAVPGSALTSTVPSILLFTSAAEPRERDLEQRVHAKLSAPEMRGWLKRLSSDPNQVGSPHDKLE